MQLLLNTQLPLASIAFEFEINGSQLALGLFGTNPYFLGGYLSFHRVKYKANTKLKTLEESKKVGEYLLYLTGLRKEK